MCKDLVQIINNIDQEELGEVLMDIAEGLLYKDANIAICKISFDDLKNENFDNIEKLDYYEYGDWDNLSGTHDGPHASGSRIPSANPLP